LSDLRRHVRARKKTQKASVNKTPKDDVTAVRMGCAASEAAKLPCSVS
jgi:hypothetical protein